MRKRALCDQAHTLGVLVTMNNVVLNRVSDTDLIAGTSALEAILDRARAEIIRRNGLQTHSEIQADVRQDVLDEATLLRDRAVIYQKVSAAILSEKYTPGVALCHVYREIYADKFHPQSAMRFVTFAAPLARQLVLDRANADGQIGTTGVTFADLRACLSWLDVVDTMRARIADYYYFGGLNPLEIAEVLKCSVSSIMRELRCVKRMVSGPPLAQVSRDGTSFVGRWLLSFRARLLRGTSPA